MDVLHKREALNLGHTIGHALEGSTNGKITHGRAVGLGIIAAARISVLKGLLREETMQLIKRSIRNIGLPASAGVMDREKISSLLAMDKKRGSFVLLKDIGEIETNQRVEENFIKKAILEVTS